MHATTTDVVVVGGGINGCAIAADAAGRGLSVTLVEQDDLASGTSSQSSKLIHGGLRYLEHRAYRLVREALAEREVVLAMAPHIVWPLRFVLPHVPGLRPPWMIRAGLFLYDHLAPRRALPRSRGLDLRHDPAGRPLAADLTRGFAYWDCWVDDARLVVAVARAAAERGAVILTRAEVTAIRAEGHRWAVEVARRDGSNSPLRIEARALVNAAGPWVDRVAARVEAVGDGGGGSTRPRLRLVKGSHIVVPRVAGADDAYLFQNRDGRVVFALPFEQRFTIIGTTDVPFTGDPGAVAIDRAEEGYLLELAARFFRTPPVEADIVWRYSGVRPLYDDAESDPSAISRDYRLELAAGGTVPPLLTVLGGKVTTWRRLAEEAMNRLGPHLPRSGPAWTAGSILPGGDMPGGDFAGFVQELVQAHPGLDEGYVHRLARRHGADAAAILVGVRKPDHLGADLGGSLTEREVLWLRDHEWARTAEDVLWRRTKAGLHMTPEERARAEQAIARLLG